MEIIIEVGNDKQKEIIRKELDYYVNIIDELEIKPNISQIIIPENFDQFVNDIENRSDYSSKQGIDGASVYALAKMIKSENGIVIALHSFLYTASFDKMIRSFILLHEIGHAFNEKLFPEIPIDSIVLKNYFDVLYHFYDEYFADRFAYRVMGVIFDGQSTLWNKFIEDNTEKFFSVASDDQYYDLIREEIKFFRIHKNEQLFIDGIMDLIYVVSETTIHGFSRFHHLGKTSNDLDIPKSIYFNASTFILVNYYKKKFEAVDRDLSDGIDVIREYMKNFGILLEEDNDGEFITILDI